MMLTARHSVDYTWNIVWNRFTHIQDSSGTRGTRVSLKINI